MNIFFKAYCRIFQQCFHIAIPILPYREPEIVESIRVLPVKLKEQGISKVLLVTDKPLRDIGRTVALEGFLSDNGVDYVIYDKTCANPTVANVEEAYELYKSEGCNGIIALGGGSPMDCAKCVGVRVVKPNKTLNQLGGILKVHKKLPLIAAIPTTAGTGSEVTLAAVITDDATRHKYAIEDFPLIPRMAVLDPKVTFSLPPHLTATTGMDAMTHAVEAYIGMSTTKKTRKYSLDAVKLIFENIEKAYADGHDETARQNMLDAAYMAGNAFSMSYVGYVHAVAHSLGGKYNIPHGLANSVLLPVVLEAYGSKIDAKLSRLAKYAGVADEGDSEAIAAKKFITAIKEMNKRMNIPTTLPGIKREDIPMLSKRAAKEANPLYPVPVLWGADELEQFYYAVMEEEKC